MCLIQALPFQGNQAYRQIGRVKLQYDRGQRARWQPPEIRHSKIRDVADRSIAVGARLEVDLDEADAGQRTRFNMVDPAT